MIPINKRNIATCVLLSIITFGLYLIYWEHLLVKNTKAIKKDESSCTGEMLCLVCVPFYFLYWCFTRGKIIKDEFSKHGYTATGNEIAYLVLGLFGLGIVSMAIMQNDFNSLTTEVADASQQSNQGSDAIKSNASDKEALWVGRIVVLIIAVVAYFIASSKSSAASGIMNLVENAWGGFGASFGPVIILSLFWKRFNYKGAIAGVVCGAVTDILWLILVNNADNGFYLYEIVPGFIVGTLAAVIVTLITPEPKQEVKDLFDKAVSLSEEE